MTVPDAIAEFTRTDNYDRAMHTYSSYGLNREAAIRGVRRRVGIVFVLSLLVNVGMWFERFVIVLSLEMDFLPSAWDYYLPTWVDFAMLIGSFGLFLTLFLLFIRYLPVIAIAEIKAIMPEANPHAHHHDHDEDHHHAQVAADAGGADAGDGETPESDKTEADE